MSATSPLLPTALPAPGQLVLVRSRHWLVDAVFPAELPGHSPRVRLSCADDDAQGQELEVFWDYELDRHIFAEESWTDVAARGMAIHSRPKICPFGNAPTAAD
jgi:hypothetical protein